jgi:hypothetical protein
MTAGRAAVSRGPLTLAALTLWAGCAAGLPELSYEANPRALLLPELVIHQDSTGALSYHAPSGRDAQQFVPRGRAKGRACQRGFQIPLLWNAFVPPHNNMGTWSLSAGWGEGGYARALEDMRSQLPADALLYDLQADLHMRTVLSVYAAQCLELDAAVALPAQSAVTP